ncbi:PD-(D/E)XK nuclease-like domain-containing protein, partial [Thalassospira aquimaris]
DPCPEPSLSSSGAKLIMAECPLKFWYQNKRLNKDAPEQERKRHFDFGQAAHDRLLLADHFNGRYHILPEGFNAAATKKWSEAIAARDEAEAAGKIALRFDDAQKVEALVKAVREHPVARYAFENIRPEMSGFYRDPEFGIWCRVRYDSMPINGGIFADLKTDTSAKPSDFGKKAADLGYYQQDAWYRDSHKALTGEDMQAFVFVVVEKEPPYCVSVIQLEPFAVQWGQIQNRKAKEIFARCLDSGHWPAYADDVVGVDLPNWKNYQLEMLHGKGAFDIEAQKPVAAQ